MTENTLQVVVLAALVATPLLGRLASWLTRRALAVAPGQIANTMSSLPTLKPQGGALAARFERSVRQAQPRLLQKMANENAPFDAASLAGSLALDPEVVAEALARLRTQVPCRLQVTAGGALLHHFSPEELRRLRRLQRTAWGQRGLLWLLTVCANFGATWLFVLGMWTTWRTVTAPIGSEAPGPLAMAAQGLVLIGLIVVLSVAAGYLVPLLVSPWQKGPRLARPALDEPADAPDGSGTIHAFAGGLDRALKVIFRGAWRNGLNVLLFTILLALALAVVAASLAVVALWLQGLWRATWRIGEPAPDQSPRSWLTTARKSPIADLLMPTNDLAMRAVRALQRGLAGSFADAELPQRVLNLAAQQGGSVAALDLMLSCGLGPQQALDVGAQLCVRAGGDVRVSEAGDVDFCFLNEVLRNCQTESTPPEFEYRNPLAEGPVCFVPVNVPGLTLDDLAGLGRLAGGPLAALALVAAGGPLWGLTAHLNGLEQGLIVLLCLLTPATMVFVAAVRTLVLQAAHQGLLRDARRLAMRSVLKGLPQRVDSLSAEDLAAKHLNVVDCADPSLTLQDVQAAVEVALYDLGLRPNAAMELPLADLRDRLRALQVLRQQPTAAGQVAVAAIVFDTAAIRPV